MLFVGGGKMAVGAILAFSSWEARKKRNEKTKNRQKTHFKRTIHYRRRLIFESCAANMR